jgi:competence protein ComEA
LGLIVAGLALAALAAQREAPPGGPPIAVFAPDHAPKPELRALRDGQRLELNRASAEELALIPGIGPKLAQRIVDERTRRNGFTDLAQLRAVRGVGPKVWLRIEPFIALDQVSNK